jgi:hypothetical protein
MTNRRPAVHRSDYGTWRKNARDQNGLLLTAEAKYMRMDTLAEWLAPGYAPTADLPSSHDVEFGAQEKMPRGGKRTGTPWPDDRRHRMMAVQRLVQRWVERMKCAESWQPWAGQAPWVRINQRGLVELHLDCDEQGNPYWTDIPWPEDKKLRDDGCEYLSHYHRINVVRIALARGDVKEVPTKHTWHSEREIEATLPQKRPGVKLPHKTDGYVELDVDWTWQFERRDGDIDLISLPRGSRIAIEVELSRKGFAVYEQFILPDLLQFYDFALYFATKDAYQAVVEARRKYMQTNDQRRRIRIILLN